MQIEGPKRTNATDKTGKTKKAGSVSGSSFSELLSETSEVGAAAPTVNVAGVNMLLALQAAEHATDQDQRKQAIEQADDLLADLEDLRVGLLLGNYTVHQLRQLGARLQQQRARITDPQLMALLSDIELRAAVELAKYE
jgi:Class II flagellar assembly regulator